MPHILRGFGLRWRQTNAATVQRQDTTAAERADLIWRCAAVGREAGPAWGVVWCRVLLGSLTLFGLQPWAWVLVPLVALVVPDGGAGACRY
jgi:hypothetical protein